MSARSARYRTSIATLFVSCVTTAACSSPPCAERDFPSIPVVRLVPIDSAGNRIDAQVARVLEDGNRSPSVPLGDLWRLDPTPLQGRGAFIVVISAIGFADTTLVLPEDCSLTRSPAVIRMRRS